MKKYFCCCLCVSLLSFIAQAQSVENTINLYGQNYRQEKIHIHFDKEVYLPGETIWFKAYIFEEEQPSERSTNFYAALYDEQGKLVQQQLSPIFHSVTDGHFEIPDSLQSKQLICRAYTSWMLNFDSTFLFTKSIKLINKNAKEADEKSVNTVSLQLLPEGGNIIEDTRNTIAFKANYPNGLPFDVNGVIKKQETGEVVMPLKAVHDGMGRFDIDIEPNQKYYAEWANDKGELQRTYLPGAKATGVSIKMAQRQNNIIFNIVNKLPTDTLHVLMYMYQKVFYKTNIAVPATEPYTAIIPVSSLPSGVMQLTVFDAGWHPVAERVAFINNNNYELGATVSNKETSIQKKGKNIIEIEIADTIVANMSLSVTDAELNNEETGSTIVTDLLLSGDIKGFVHNPAYYFTGAKDAKAHLDLVMLTHGWRRYNWDNIVTAKMPDVNYAVDDYLTAYGQIGKAILEKLDKDEQVNLIIKAKDSTRNFYFLSPGKDGLVKKGGLIFYDTANVLYSLNKNKLFNSQLVFSPANLTYTQPGVINNSGNFFIQATTSIKYNQAAALFSYYNNNKANQTFNKEKTLQTVVVKSGGWHNWKNDPLFKLDEKYTVGLFRGGVSVDAFDVLHDDMAEAAIDIYNYIGYKSHYVFLVYKKGVKTLTSRNGVPFVFVNEQKVDFSFLETISISDVAYIKIIESYFGERNDNGIYGPAVSIYLKKGDDLIDRRTKDTDLKSIKIAGYSPLKEFYSPDYSLSNTTMGTDARTTLLWQPYIFTDANNHKVPITFYNNDFTKKIRIVLEGINAEGKMIHIEKIIE
ncbi:MAG: hypothetical protein ABIW38_01215 [Ferruginibacter sp.]